MLHCAPITESSHSLTKPVSLLLLKMYSVQPIQVIYRMKICFCFEPAGKFLDSLLCLKYTVCICIYIYDEIYYEKCRDAAVSLSFAHHLVIHFSHLMEISSCRLLLFALTPRASQRVCCMTFNASAAVTGSAERAQGLKGSLKCNAAPERLIGLCTPIWCKRCHFQM